MLSALRDDALTTTTTGIALRIGLPWIRSLPIACVRGIELVIDEGESSVPRVRLGERVVSPGDLVGESGWWFAQDRVVLESDTVLSAGSHDVVVSFRLLIPYLMAGPGGGPLDLPMRLAATLELDHAAMPSVSLDVA